MGKRSIIVLLLVFIAGDQGISQPRFVYSKAGFIDTLYNIEKDPQVPRETGFCFPEYDYYSKNISSGYTVISSGGSSWKMSIQTPIILKKDTTGIYYHAYAVNIKRCSLYACFPKYGVWKKEIEIESDGYQLPYMSYFSQWTAVSDSERFARQLTGDDAPGKDMLQLMVVITPTDIRKPCKWTFGQLLIGEYVEKMAAIRHPFFDALLTETGKPLAVHQAHDASPDALQSQFLARSNFNQDFRDLSGEITVKGIETEQQHRQLLIDLLEKTLKEYPFYQERQRSPQVLLRDFHRMIIALKDSSLCTLADSVRDFISKGFSDPHFGLQLPENCQLTTAPTTKPGIRIYRIGKEVFVSAVFDTLYAQNMQVGDTVLSIDGKNIASLLDHDPIQTGKVSGNYHDVSELLNGKKTDQIPIVTVGRNGKKTTLLRYEKPYPIPANFRSKSFSLQFDSAGIACLRFNHWTIDLYSRLISQWERISQAKGLIIDLRGNGGGDLLTVIRALSLFIDTPTVLFNAWTTAGIDPLIVRNDPEHHFPRKTNIVILVDGGTVCASECFIKGMQSLPNVRIIGNTGTYGAVAYRYDIHFPNGMDLYIDCVAHKTVFTDNTCIAGTGIQPQIKIAIRSVEDLQPYRDLVLSTARECILNKPI